ncbi:FecR family protein [Flagellimonas pacifica]|uniref:FecR family protein n=1 Tax=Flagellimonas pacifica TaxID=1247520 RepID=A0A285MUX5_9FLAO|nr:FecR domain-containing protein [Allomuricauda parva]SNZ01000.1 FecR family protein [Allomuricauda parva]
MKEENLREGHIDQEEKEHLKQRITSSIVKYQRYKKRIRYGIGAAASIAFIGSIGFINYGKDSSSIEDYVKATEVNLKSENATEVTLILDDDKNINIDEDNTDIKYSNTGNKVKIGALKEVDQATIKNNEIVYNTLIVPFGRRSQIELSDGSKVWLNSGSKLVYPVIFKGKNREVYLEGEGIFDVVHNKKQPFIVKAENHEIEVLGTTFNVSNYPDDDYISTTLKSGSVQINYKGNSFLGRTKTMQISPGTQAVYTKTASAISAEKVDVDKYFSWRQGVFIFKRDNLKYIMKRLSRYYNVDIVINDKILEKQTFSGYLDLKEDVGNVVKIIKETANFEYAKQNGNQIIIN